MTVEIKYRKRWKQAVVALIVILLLSKVQSRFFNNMPNFLFEVFILLTALLFYAFF